MEPNETTNDKPFALLSAILAAVALIGAIMVWLRRANDTLTVELIASIAAAAAIALFFVTTGWCGIGLASWWTIAIAVLAAIPIVLSLQAKAKGKNS